MAPLNSGQTLNPRYPMWSLCFLTQVVKQHNAVVFWEGMLWPLELLLTSGKRLLEFLLEGSCMLFVLWNIIFKTLIIFVGICRNNLGCSWSCWLLSMNMALGDLPAEDLYSMGKSIGCKCQKSSQVFGELKSSISYVYLLLNVRITSYFVLTFLALLIGGWAWSLQISVDTDVSQEQLLFWIYLVDSCLKLSALYLIVGWILWSVVKG